MQPASFEREARPPPFAHRQHHHIAVREREREKRKRPIGSIRENSQPCYGDRLF